MAYIKMQDVLDELASHNKAVFSINDIAMIVGKTRHYISKLLTNSKKVGKIENGKYYLKGCAMPDIYEIASQIVFPSYISMFAAFQFYSITEQSVIKYSVITIKRHKAIEVNGSAIEFITLGRGMFFGYKKVGNVYIATVEKAIIDSLYLGSPPLSYVEEAFSEALHKNIVNPSRLVDMTLRIKSRPVARRVYALLESNGIDASGLAKAIK